MILIIHKCNEGKKANNSLLSAKDTLINYKKYSIETDVNLNSKKVFFNSDNIKKVKKILTAFNYENRLILFDLKSNNTLDELKVKKSIQFILTYVDSKNFIITSFDHVLIKKIKKQFPNVQTCIIITANLISLKKYILNSKCNYIHIEKEYLTKEIVNFTKKHNINIIIANIKSTDDIEQYSNKNIKYGVLYSFLK